MVVAASLVWAPEPAFACSCAPATLAEQAELIDIAFTGQQIERDVRDDFADDGVRLVFDVDRVYKGEVTTPAEVFTTAQEAACGASFGDNVPTGVVGYERDGKVFTDLCSQLMETGEAKLQAVFGEGIVPVAVVLEETADETTSWMLVLTPFIAIGCAALAIVMGRRRSRRTDT